MIGADSPRGLLIDVVVMLTFAAVGYLVKRFGYPIMGFILGFILAVLLKLSF